jgi:cytochrome c oxidase subunit I+III
VAVLVYRSAGRRLSGGGHDAPRILPWLILAAAVLAIGSVALEFAGQWRAGVRPIESSYAAMVFMACVLNAELVVAFAIMAGFTAARCWCGKIDAIRRACVENTGLLLIYTAAQTTVGLIIVHGFPRLV